MGNILLYFLWLLTASVQGLSQPANKET